MKKEKTLIEKRKELFEVILNEDLTPVRIYRMILEQDKQFIDEILGELKQNAELDLKNESFPKSTIFAFNNYFVDLIKQKAGFE